MGHLGGGSPFLLPQEYSAVKSLEVIVRANITVKSSIKNLVLRDASTVVSCRAGRWCWGSSSLLLPDPCSINPSLPRSP